MLPDDDYLLKIGRLTYSVTLVEGLVLSELSRLTGLPPGLRARKLTGRSAGAIGKALQDPGNIGHVTDPAVREWLRVAGEELAAVARLSHALLHARPAEAGEEPRLHRWPAEVGESFDITHAWLDTAQSTVDDAIRQVDRSRVPSRV
ncbi:hypothetical protein ACWGR4_34580 [Embleya sp. NPDC055664]|uniref:hypothetical protein n=1 Tax=Embleya sp. MST-111070 TaxID=3398231 RepID=UPI003F7326C3